jgi:hypothetical protein
MSDFRIKFTLSGGIGLFTSPPSDSLDLALMRAADLKCEHKATIEGIVGVEGYFVIDRDGCARLLQARLGRGYRHPNDAPWAASPLPPKPSSDRLDIAAGSRHRAQK